jgi:hypothetical protein
MSAAPAPTLRLPLLMGTLAMPLLLPRLASI